MIKSYDNPFQYFVYGKTKVKNNICEFNGVCTILSSNIFIDDDFPEYKCGTIISLLKLFENTNQPFSGMFVGTLTSHFIIDPSNNFRYNCLRGAADSFNNNLFIGNWINYKSLAQKKCHWGDVKIPDCSDLDIGAGEFWINKKYIKNGWENYDNAYGSNALKGNPKIYQTKENEKWWK
ncbi:MAG: hypothetical protein EAZ53_13545 [Bacteroidetes bacterium]|nr:MAG: hypothetical protein EAZ53_13545 [Bacteroidota bacterium]